MNLGSLGGVCFAGVQAPRGPPSTGEHIGTKLCPPHIALEPSDMWSGVQRAARPLGSRGLPRTRDGGVARRENVNKTRNNA